MDKKLIKKELLESFSWAYRNKRTGKRRAVWKTVLLLCLYALCFAWLMFTFYRMGRQLCFSLQEQDLEWLFFVLMGLLSMQVVGLTNAFHAYAALRRLHGETALPEGPKAICGMLWAKFAGTYIMGLFYSLVFMIPGVIVHLQFTDPTLPGFIFTLFVPILLGLLSLVESIVIAWLVSIVSRRIHNKNLLTVIAGIGLAVCYYVLYDKSQDIFAAVLNNAKDVAYWTERLAYPFYRMGLAAQGDPLSMLVFVATVAIVMILSVILLWVSYRSHVLKRKAV